MAFIVTDAFWELFPTARIGVLTAHDLSRDAAAAAAAAALLAEVAAERAAQLAGADIATHPAVAPWRAAYRRFGLKPSHYRSSIESLLRAAQAGRTRSIDPLVDLYNAMSLRHMLPCGGEDLATLVGPVCLTCATGGEPFRTIGATADDPPQPGEVIYRDDAGVICRGWNWREAERTRLRDETRAALLVFEALPEHPPEVLEHALTDLAALVGRHLGGTTRWRILTRDAPACTLPPA